MKNWKMPLINVDRFSANEYVAACYQMITDLTGTMHWDYDHDGHYGGNGEDVSRRSDGLYNFQRTRTPGWHSAEEFWRDTDASVLFRVGRRYDGQNLWGQDIFSHVGTFVVYDFGDGTIGIYRGNMITEGRTPTKVPAPGHLFS